jgi:Zn-dependent protease with chaperone function
MAVSMRDIFRWSRFALILSAVIFALCALVAVIAAPEYMGLYDTATYQARIVLFIMPPAALICALSGLLLRYSRKSSAAAETRLARIMQRLSPDEREYLQQELDERLAGIGDDGELLSLDELLDKQESKAQH